MRRTVTPWVFTVSLIDCSKLALLTLQYFPLTP